MIIHTVMKSEIILQIPRLYVHIPFSIFLITIPNTRSNNFHLATRSSSNHCHLCRVKLFELGQNFVRLKGPEPATLKIHKFAFQRGKKKRRFISFWVEIGWKVARHQCYTNWLNKVQTKSFPGSTIKNCHHLSPCVTHSVEDLTLN